MAQVFVSHVEEDSDTAIAVADSMESIGYTTWYYERDSIPGPDYLDQICEAIEQCAVVILVLSEDALDSHQVGAEIIRAFETRRRFLPVLKDISHIEFQNRKPGWRMALGAATSIAIPTGGVSAIADRIDAGIRKLGVVPAAAPAHRLDQGATAESVQYSLFAPTAIDSGESFLVHIWIHPPDRGDEVQRRSEAFDEGVRRRLSGVLSEVPTGGSLALDLRVGDFPVRSLSTCVTWQGDPAATLFRVLTPREARSAIEIGQMRVFCEDLAMAAGNFRVRIASARAQPVVPPPGDSVPLRKKKAFLCYANADREEVLRRADALSAVGLELVLDIASLATADRWHEKLLSLIDEADVFVLFWSTAAARSTEVEREWRYALNRKGLDFILPVVLERPLPPPPPELAALHFGESLAYLIQTEAVG